MNDPNKSEVDSTSPPEKEILQVQNLITSFRSPSRTFNAVDNCSFNVHKGRTLGIVGESGCGKSVTSLSIMRLVPNPPGKITHGKIIFENQNLIELPESEIRAIRGNKISMIFQEPMTSLNPVYTIGNQISEVFLLHKDTTKKEAHEMSIEALRQVRIPAAEQKVNDYPHQLSGGMRQRVMIAMALACKPKLLIADEPTTALDVTIQAQILALMNELQQQSNMSIILITHDLGVVAETCDDVAVMYAGKIVETAPTVEMFSTPKHPYTMGLLESTIKLGEKKTRLSTIKGSVPSPDEYPKGCRFQDRCPFAFDTCREHEPPLIPISNKRSVACFKATKS